MTRALRASLILAMALLLVTSAGAQSGMAIYRSQGEQPFAGLSSSEARSRAIDRAEQDAVLSACRDILSEDGLAAHEEAVRRAVLSRWETFVQGYELVRESASGEAVRVELEVRVFYDRLRDALLALPEIQAGGDQVLVLAVDPEAGGDPLAAFRDALEGAIVQGGRAAAGTEAREKVQADAGFEKALLGDFGPLASAARMAGCRHVVLARKVESGPEGCLARVSLVVLDTGAAQPLVSKTYRVNPQPGGCEPTERGAAAALARVVLEKLGPAEGSKPAEATGESTAPAETRVLLEATGFTRLADLERFQHLVLAQEGVTDCRLAQVRSGTHATFVAAFTGSAGDLAKLLDGKRYENIVVRTRAPEGARVAVIVQTLPGSPDAYAPPAGDDKH